MSAPDPVWAAQYEQASRPVVVVLALGYNTNTDPYNPPSIVDRRFAVSSYGTFLSDGVTQISAGNLTHIIDGNLKSLAPHTISLEPVTRSGWAREGGGGAVIANPREPRTDDVIARRYDHWRDMYFDGRPFDVRVGFDGDTWADSRVLWSGLIKGEPVFDGDEISVTLEASTRFVNKVIEGEAVGGTGAAKDERLPVVIGHARSLPLVVYDGATNRYRVTGSTFWSDNSSLRWKDVCALHQQGRYLFRAAGFTLTLSGADDYVSNVAHNLIVGEVIDWSFSGVRQYRYVVAVVNATTFKVSTTFGGAAIAHGGPAPTPFDVYGYAIEAGQIIRLTVAPGGVQTYADVTSANISFIRPYVAGVGNFPYKASKIGRVIESLAVTYGALPSYAFDAPSFDAADATYADASYACRMVTTSADRINVLGEIGTLAESVGAYVFFDNSKMRCGYMHGVPTSPVATLSEAWLVDNQEPSFERLIPDAKSITLRYRRNESPYSEFVALTSDDEKVERATQFPRSVTTPISTQWERWPRLDGRSYDTPFTAPDASGPALQSAVSNIALTLRDVTNHNTYLVRIATRLSTAGLTIGDVVTVPWNRYSFGGTDVPTRDGWIVGRTIDPLRGQINYEVVVRYV